jgi:protein-disulfide isomerase
MAAPLEASSASGFCCATKGNEAEIVIGNPNATVTVVEYFAVSCDHCAHWREDVYPALKSKYVDSGKVKFVFREFTISPADAAGFLVARCAGPQRYLEVIDALFQNQSLLLDKRDGHLWLMSGAKAGGLTETEMRTCTSNSAALNAFNARVKWARDTQKIDSTPTIVINGKIMDHMSLEKLSAVIDPLLTK